MCDDYDLGEGPGPMTFGRFFALAVFVAGVATLALIGLSSLILAVVS